MSLLLNPETSQSSRYAPVGVVILLIASAISIFSATVVMPSDYSWQSNAISESAAQGVQNAWIARLGFILFGFAVLWLSISLKSSWPRVSYWMHLAFGVFMLSTAAFSHKPWVAELPYDAFEDFLHSVTATAMGFAFSIGVLARFIQRERANLIARSFDVVALLAAIMIPLSAIIWPSSGGLTQRLMFLIAYLWYGMEAMKSRSPELGVARSK